MKQTNWEKEFDKKFINGEDYFNYKSIKHFIADLLEEQKKDILGIDFYGWDNNTQEMIKDKILNKLNKQIWGKRKKNN